MILALLRLLDLSSGRICIDENDISSIGVEDLRSIVSVLPQEPFLFNGTISRNLDPQNAFSDNEVVEVLIKLGLWEILQKMGLSLHSELTEDVLSHGQRQLLCLGRTILQRRKIIVLDEASSSLDEYTDAVVQKVIRTEFSDCTIISVTHRLNTILDFDKVAVMNGGNIVELGQPSELLSNPESRFSIFYRSDSTI